MNGYLNLYIYNRTKCLCLTVAFFIASAPASDLNLSCRRKTTILLLTDLLLCSSLTNEGTANGEVGPGKFKFDGHQI